MTGHTDDDPHGEQGAEHEDGQTGPASPEEQIREVTHAVALELRDAEAVRLRRQGHTLVEIAQALDYADHTGALRAVRRGLARYVREAPSERVDVELAAMDAQLKVLWRIVGTDHVATSFGKIVELPDGTPAIDDMPKIAALREIRAVSERRSRLLGLDAPTKSRVDVVSHDAIEAAIVELEGQVARSRAALDTHPADSADGADSAPVGGADT